MAQQRSARTITLAIQRFDRTAALHTRTVTIDNTLVVYVLPGTSVAGVLDGTFDAAEMPLAHYAFLRSIGAPFTAIPVFPDRLFLQQYIYTRPDTGIRTLADLRGRRVLVPMYYMTASFWHRGMLQEDFGIRPQEIEWHTTSPERDARMHLPADVRVVLSRGPHLGLERLLDGTTDCLMTEGTPVVPPDQRPSLVRVHADVQALQREYFQRTGFHPIVHVIVLRQDAVEARPGIVEELCDAFDRAKQSAYYQLQNERTTGLPLMRGYLDETIELFGDDPWPYGLGERNRAELDRFLAYAHDQGLTERRLEPEALFDPPAREFPFRATMVPDKHAGGLSALLGYLRDD
jgi:4,5-dihydroxyphthalate decarboxylase